MLPTPSSCTYMEDLECHRLLGRRGARSTYVLVLSRDEQGRYFLGTEMLFEAFEDAVSSGHRLESRVVWDPKCRCIEACQDLDPSRLCRCRTGGDGEVSDPFAQ